MPDQLRRAVSAGGVVYRKGRGGVEIVLCGRRREKLWALPKGTPEPGETIAGAASREVREETGLEVAVERVVGSIRYRFTAPDGTIYDKRVEHHLMTPVGGDLAAHDSEFDDVCWTGLEDALNLLSYPNERAIVQRAARLIDSQGEQ